MGGANWHQTHNTRKATPTRNGCGKKLPETLSQLIAAWPGDTPVKLMFQDEARFGRISDVRRCWAPFPVGPLCHGMLTHKYIHAYGEVDVVTGAFEALMLPQVNTECTEIFLNEVAIRRPQERVIIVLDGADWHRNAAQKSAAEYAAVCPAALFS